MQISEIKTYMKQNKITYEVLAKKSGVSISTIKDIFRGATYAPRLDTMQAIEQALGIPSYQPSDGKAMGKEMITEDEYELLEYYRSVKSDDKKMTARAILKTLAETE